VLLITAGWLGDILGPRQLLAASLVVFSAASALCGLSQDAGQLVAAGVVQGIGGALIAPADHGSPWPRSVVCWY
jgi:MFS family permease